MKRVAIIATSIAILSGTFFLGPPSCEEKFDQAFRILSVALSILAGMVLAIMALLGDPSSLFLKKWREARTERHLRTMKLSRFKLLFQTYLFVISIALFTTILDAYQISEFYRQGVLFLKRFALSLGCVALLWSFWLPSAILAAQKERLRSGEEEIRERDTAKREDL